jgi:hypothetical protein
VKGKLNGELTLFGGDFQHQCGIRLQMVSKVVEITKIVEKIMWS